MDNHTTEIRLILGANGLTQKRIQYSRITPASNPDFPGGRFVYDTMMFEYDAEGFLKKTTGSGYDSNWVSFSYNSVKKFNSTVTYTTENGNLIASDEHVDYPYVVRDGGTTTLLGGSSDYHAEFGYTKAYPNQREFRNAAVLNEFKEYWDTPHNSNYKNMPDRVARHNIDRNLAGEVLWDLKGEIDMERTYSAGVLSTVTMPKGKTQFTQIDYFYE
jgi:hypothetical protein